jgi:hypothetical protein
MSARKAKGRKQARAARHTRTGPSPTKSDRLPELNVQAAMEHVDNSLGAVDTAAATIMRRAPGDDDLVAAYGVLRLAHGTLQTLREALEEVLR